MLGRRDFLRNSGKLALAGLLLPETSNAFLNGTSIHPMGLQLYTLFNVIDDDVQGTLKKVAAIGYKEIESAFSKKGGYYGMKPREFRKTLKESGLSWKSHHVLGAPFKLPAGAKLPTGPDGKPITIPPMRNLKENRQELVDEAAEGGIPYLVCANSPMGTLDELRSSIEVLNKTGEACQKAGITLAYHNHDMEFQEVEDLIPYHLLLSQTSPETLKMELDLAWATKAGVDPVELFTQHPGRFPLWHVKDISKDLTTIEPVGNGSIDFKRIFAKAKVAGMKHFFVEQDGAPQPIQNVTNSYNYLKQL